MTAGEVDDAEEGGEEEDEGEEDLLGVRRGQVGDARRVRSSRRERTSVQRVVYLHCCASVTTDRPHQLSLPPSARARASLTIAPGV